MSVLYHPGKANVVVDALSRMSMGSVTYVGDDKKEIVRDVHRLALLGVRLEESPKGGFTVHHNSESSLVVEVNLSNMLILYWWSGKNWFLVNLMSPSPKERRVT